MHITVIPDIQILIYWNRNTMRIETVSFTDISYLEECQIHIISSKKKIDPSFNLDSSFLENIP